MGQLVETRSKIAKQTVIHPIVKKIEFGMFDKVDRGVVSVLDQLEGQRPNLAQTATQSLRLSGVQSATRWPSWGD